MWHILVLILENGWINLSDYNYLASCTNLMPGMWRQTRFHHGQSS